MTSETTPDPTATGHAAGPARRTVLRGAAVLGVLGVGGALSGCGGGSGGSSGSSEAVAGTVLGPVSDVPSGGGKIYPAAKIVVTQPSMGEYKAFSAVCTHQSCIVATVSDGTINCTCHGSKY